MASPNGVVRPARAGMASGINSTLRQVGIATGIAALGAIFAAELRHTVAGRLAASPLAAHAQSIAAGIGGSKPAGAPAGGTAAARQAVAAAVRAGFADGLNRILLVGAIAAAVAAIASLALIRGRDFVVVPAAPAAEGARAATAQPADVTTH